MVGKLAQSAFSIEVLYNVFVCLFSCYNYLLKRWNIFVEQKANILIIFYISLLAIIYVDSST